MIVIFNYPDGAGRQYTQFRYPGGEVQVRLTELSIKMLKNPGTDRVFVVAKITDGEIVALAQLMDAIKSVTSVDIKLILPYLPYARADRSFVEGDCKGLAVFGRMLSVISYDTVTLDAHSDQAKKYIQHLRNVSPKPIIETVQQSIAADNPGQLVSIMLPDEGASRYEINTPWHASKKRDPETGKLSGFTVPSRTQFCENQSVLIVDDICDGGGTFLGIADQIKDYGLDLYLYVTHGIFSKGFDELFKRFKRIYTTDSFPSPAVTAPAFVRGQDRDRLIIIPCMGTILDQIIPRSELYKNAESSS